MSWGEQETRKVKLSQGFELGGTPEHPVVVMEDGRLKFKKLGEVEIGDAVAVSFGQRMFGQRQEVDVENSVFIGNTLLVTEICQYPVEWV